MALLLVPLVSLVAIWAFAAVITSHGVFGLIDVKQVADKIGYPVQDTVDALSGERKAVLVYLADQTDAVANLRSAELRTDKDLGLIRTNIAEGDIRSDLDSASQSRLAGLFKQADGLDALRRKVDEGKISRTEAFAAYNGLIDPYYNFFLGLDPVQNVPLDRQTRVLTELARARETISREDALYAADQIAGNMSHADQRAFSDAVSQQRSIYQTYLPLLSGVDGKAIADYWRDSSNGRALHRDEEKILDVSAAGATDQITPVAWQSTTTAVLNDMSTLNRQVDDAHFQKVKPYAIGVLAKAAIAGGFGLIAVIVSVVVSLRVGRGLVRDLSTLRKEAQEASGTRLPRVMRRLAAGEEVDIEAEVPRTAYADDEIGAVGKALDTLQRAAVEAAVRQADMRRGVSDVFVNLARRNQVLLHRQLTLLDAMERRTEAGDELADLFRLDHMTTRMRRHAEGLVILSGAAPSRQWRKPVPLMDVVRAAVAEVEDYERVEVRRLPRLAVAGSAVADVTHLVAELVENATVFSPPHTNVQVHGERVANGYVLEIDDRGLGMTPEALLDANLRLAETPEFELSDTDRLGLFVVSRLAQRHGVRVSLRNSAYGGTTAVVLVPNTLLTDTADEDTSHTGERIIPGAAARLPGDDAQSAADALPDEIAVTVVTEAAQQKFSDWGMVPTGGAATEEFRGAETGRHRSVPERRFDRPEQHQQAQDAPDSAGGYGERPLPRRERAARPRAGSSLADENAPLPRRRRGSSLVAESANRRSGGTPAEQEPQQMPSGLPRRVRQANLAPQLREYAVSRAQAPAEHDAPNDRDAEELRARMASLQRGWQRGRIEADENVPGTTGSTDRTTRMDAADTAGGLRGEATGTTSEGDGR